MANSCLHWMIINGLCNEKGDTLEFDSHRFMIDLIEDWSPKLVVLKAAQVGFSTMAILKAFYAALFLKYNIIYTLPTFDDMRPFVSSKVNKMIEVNPPLSKLIGDTDTVEQKAIGDAFIYYRGTHQEKQAIALSADLNIYDELDRSNLSTVDTYTSRLAYSKYKGEWKFSNPSQPDRGVSSAWNLSDQKHWFVQCEECGLWQYLDWPRNVDREQEIYVCHECNAELTDDIRQSGKWVAKYQNRRVSGYWISQMMCPWIQAHELLHLEKTKPPEFFANFVLGLPFRRTDQNVDGDTIRDAISPYDGKRSQVVMGSDSGNIKHYVIGDENGIFEVGHTDSWDEVEKKMLKYKAKLVIDALPDLTKPRELQQKYPKQVFLSYYKADRTSKELIRWRNKKERGVVYIDRNKFIDDLVDSMNSGEILFNMTEYNLTDYINHWKNMYRVEEEDSIGNMKGKWKHDPGKPDHYAHATIYWKAALDRFGGLRGPRSSATLELKGHGTPSFEVGLDDIIPFNEFNSVFTREEKKEWKDY